MAFLVFTTLPKPVAARALARKILLRRLAACAHIAPAGESHYWWKGRMENAREVAVTFKTTKKALPLLLRTLKQLHPYETPEILAVRVAAGNPGYLRWLETETRPHSTLDL
jgi:periplasmic divalent cation tolerance protein